MDENKLIKKWLRSEKKPKYDMNYKALFEEIAKKFVNAEVLSDDEKSFVVSFVDIDQTINKFFKGGTNRFSETKKIDAEVVFKIISEKIISNADLNEKEKKFMNLYFSQYYPCVVGGEFYPFPKYEEKIKGMYRELADFYFLNPPLNDMEAINFTQYYYLSEMASEYEICPRFMFNEFEYFKNKPNTFAYHRPETIMNKTFPVVSFNPFKREQIKSDIRYFYFNFVVGFHEFEHYVQTIETEKENIENPQALIWAKERAVRGYLNFYFQLGESYYNRNYEEQFIERDADFFANTRLQNVFRRMNVKSIIKSDMYKYDLSIKQIDVRDGRSDYAVDLLESITIEALKRYGPLVLSRYPVLRTIYNNDFSKKTLTQIERELLEKSLLEQQNNPAFEKAIQKKYNSLISGISKTDNGLLLESYCLDLYDTVLFNDEISFKTKLARINNFIKDKNIPYDNLLESISKRIEKLIKDKGINKLKNYEELDLLVNIRSYISSIKENNQLNIKIGGAVNISDCLEERKRYFDDVLTKLNGQLLSLDSKEENIQLKEELISKINFYNSYRTVLNSNLKSQYVIKEIEDAISMLSCYFEIVCDGEKCYAPMFPTSKDRYLKAQEIYLKIEKAFYNALISIQKKKELNDKLASEIELLDKIPDFEGTKKSIDEIRVSRAR